MQGKGVRQVDETGGQHVKWDGYGEVPKRKKGSTERKVQDCQFANSLLVKGGRKNTETLGGSRGCAIRRGLGGNYCMTTHEEECGACKPTDPLYRTAPCVGSGTGRGGRNCVGRLGGLGRCEQ